MSTVTIGGFVVGSVDAVSSVVAAKAAYDQSQTAGVAASRELTQMPKLD